MNLLELYKPYNYSDKKFFVVRITIALAEDVVPIKVKMPEEVKDVKGLFADSDMLANSNGRYLGRLVLRFNSGAITPVNIFVQSPEYFLPFPNPRKLNEEIITGSNMQGFYQDAGEAKVYPYEVAIYLVYTKPKKDCN